MSMDIHPALDIISAAISETRDGRHIPARVIGVIKETGFFRSFLPKAYGGLELSPQDFFRASIELATRDMSTSWVAGIIAVHAYQIALMDKQAAIDVYSEDPDTLVSSSYNPAGAKVETVEGGFMLSGRWGWSSGSGHCQWALLGGLIMDQPDNIHYRTFLVPISDYQIEDTWHVMGLQGTGSNDIVIDKPVFVPLYRTHHQMDGFNCKHEQDNPYYDIPWAQIFIRVVCVPAIGAARHALQLFIENATASSTDPTRLAGDPDVTRRIAEAAHLIDCTEALLFRNFDQMVAATNKGEEIPMLDRIKYRYQASLVIEDMMQAVDLLFNVAGGRSVFNDSPIQQIWHDIHIARAHVANSPVAFGRNYGAVQLGAESTDVFV